MVNHRVDASHGESPGEDRGIRGNSPDPTGTESHSERARQLHWKKIYADHPMLTVGVPPVVVVGVVPSVAKILMVRRRPDSNRTAERLGLTRQDGKRFADRPHRGAPAGSS